MGIYFSRFSLLLWSISILYTLTMYHYRPIEQLHHLDPSKRWHVLAFKNNMSSIIYPALKMITYIRKKLNLIHVLWTWFLWNWNFGIIFVSGKEGLWGDVCCEKGRLGFLKVQTENGIIIWNQLIIKNTFKTFEKLQVEYNCSTTAEESYIQLWHYYLFWTKCTGCLENTLDFECFREGSFSPTIKFY